MHFLIKSSTAILKPFSKMKGLGLGTTAELVSCAAGKSSVTAMPSYRQ